MLLLYTLTAILAVASAQYLQPIEEDQDRYDSQLEPITRPGGETRYRPVPIGEDELSRYGRVGERPIIGGDELSRYGRIGDNQDRNNYLGPIARARPAPIEDDELPRYGRVGEEQDRYSPRLTSNSGRFDSSPQQIGGRGFYRDRFDGKSYCSTIQNTCCNSRDDDCSVQIGETRCYCDVFCDQGHDYPWNRKAPDCCPDYRQVCKGASPPPPPPPNVTDCTQNEFRCDADKICINGRYQCDGTPHCRDGQDEVGCNTGCREDQFTCETDRTCINRRYRCDGYDNCRDGSDELECGEFGITLKPDIIHLEDHASSVMYMDFTCEFRSRHNLRLQLTTEPPQRALQNLPADRYSYFTTGTEQQRLPIRPNIRGIICEAFDQYGDKVLYARAKVVHNEGSIIPRSRPQPIVNPQPAACNMNDINRNCGKYTQKMSVIVQSPVPDFNRLCCVLHEQVSCFQSLNCPGIISAVMGPAQAQIQQVCSSYVYQPGCADSFPIERPGPFNGPLAPVQALPPNYAKCLDITNDTPDTIVVIATFRDEQGQREKSSAIEAGGEYQFPEEERQVPGRSYKTSIPLKNIAVLSSKDGDSVEEAVEVRGVQGCISRTIAYDLSGDGYRITQ